jgi:hypothetical protein
MAMRDELKKIFNEMRAFVSKWGGELHSWRTIRLPVARVKRCRERVRNGATSRHVPLAAAQI